MGPITVDKCARVGGNSVVTKDIGQGITVVGVPAKPIAKRRADESFTPYAISDMTSTDQTEKTLEWLSQQISELQQQIKILQEHRSDDTISKLPDAKIHKKIETSKHENK